jgi:hypothetical protein
MAVTTLQRKHRRNRSRAVNKIAYVKVLTRTPVIKNVDIEAIKKEFAEKKAQKTASAE